MSISEKNMCSHSQYSFLAGSFLSLVIDHSFLYHLSFIPFQTRSGLFIIPFLAFLEGHFLLSILRLLTNPPIFLDDSKART